LVGGVAGGLGARFGVDGNVVRLLFAVLVIADGSGLALYVLAWLVMVRQGETESVARRALADRRTVALGLAIATLLACLLIALASLGLVVLASVVWPASFAAAGLVVLWRGLAHDEKAFLRQAAEQATLPGRPDRSSRRGLVTRVVLGVGLVVLGLGILVATRHPSSSSFEALAPAAVVVLGFLVIFGPWWLTVARDLADERRQRVRSQERADMAAVVHDSVLQTLALIQRASDDPAEVKRLARAQERDLRSWLFDGRAPGSFDTRDVKTLAEGVGVIQREVEESHRVAVESVVVGDCLLDDALRALLAAGREATVNAAVWSGTTTVALFAEVENGRVSLYVRDRGRGFDPAAVPGDRRGISESIRARMARHGGTAGVRSVPGEGTEVELVMTRPGAGR
jgi:signal transduction histidine kinase